MNLILQAEICGHKRSYCRLL